jgi:glycosyltransferase involved in cell wall biosynthesis
VNPFDFSNSPFGPKLSIPQDSQVIFVADLFVEDYVGGAELTSQALIDASPFKVFKLKSRDVTIELLQQGNNKFWVFGNFCELNPQLIPSIVANLRYSVLEYDYKFCRFRSPEKHLQTSGTPCDCASQQSGKTISAFYYSSMGMWWMSEAQRERYVTSFPFLQEKNSCVLSSVFSQQTLETLRQLRKESDLTERKGWIVLGSQSWIKGFDDAEKWCKDNGKTYEVVWNVPYDQVIMKLAAAEGFVYLPKGGDTCPRMVIEAKLLGCKLHLNENVQHKDESWFKTNDLKLIHDHLSRSAGLFWEGIKGMMLYRPSISGYTTTYNAVKQQYPFEQCIRSMLEFCDEVCVVDGGSTDDTWNVLQNLQASLVPSALLFDCDASRLAFYNAKSPLKLKQVFRDWNSKRHPVFDGMQKAEARKMCTKEFCWQMDSDEIVHEDDGKRILELCRSLPGNIDLIALPVIEYWGGPDKVRMDIQPWKWRLSRNKLHITHGIPIELRRTDSEGLSYAAPGTDGCDMIDALTGERIPFINFYSQEVEQARQVAMLGNEQARQQYESWFNQVVVGLPGVFHYSWYDLPRKIKLYKNYWQSHWNSLWNKDASDTAENNLMFGIPWVQVTDEMIEQRAAQMKELLGGWIWHRAWDGKTTTPHIKCNRTQPKVML